MRLRTTFYAIVIILLACFVYWFRPSFQVSIILGALLLLFMLWKLPQLQVAKIKATSESERFNLENEARKTLAEILGGIVVIGGLYFTWQGLVATQKSIENNQESIKLSQNTAELSLNLSKESLTRATQAQLTERYTKAIEQLGSNNLNVRVGAILALERIANDSTDYYWPVMETLTNYVRQTTNPHLKSKATTISQDIQTILRVLGRRKHSYKNGEDQRLNLVGADLRGAIIEKDVHFEGVSFREANLEGAKLTNARLDNAILHNTNLRNAILFNANLAGADLKGANLSGADLNGTEGLTVGQVHLAKWDETTIFSDEFKEQLMAGNKRE